MIDFTNLKSLYIPDGEVVKIMRGSELLWEKETKKYKKELEYIESTGTQYIDTGISGDNDNLTITIKYNLLKYYSYSGIFGNYKGENINCWRLIQTNTNNASKYICYNTAPSGGTVTTNISDNVINTVTVAKNKIIRNGVVSTHSANKKGTANNSSILVFTQRSDAVTSRSSMRLYSFQIKDGDTLVRDFIPVLDMNNIACLYDNVTEQKFYNAGTGEFIYPNIEDEYKEVGYIESTGTQWIDTGIDAISAPSIEIKFKSTQYNAGNYAYYYIGAMNGGAVGIGVKKSSASTVIVKDYNRATTTVEVDSSAEWNEVFINTKDMTLSVDNNTVALEGFYWPESYSTTFALFATKSFKGGISSGTKVSIAYCRFYDSDMNLIRDFVPCYRKSDGEAGMYDLVTKSFFTNQGTGNFVYPTDIEVAQLMMSNSLDEDMIEALAGVPTVFNSEYEDNVVE